MKLESMMNASNTIYKWPLFTVGSCQLLAALQQRLILDHLSDVSIDNENNISACCQTIILLFF